jgi:hypothetical protein
MQPCHCMAYHLFDNPFHDKYHFAMDADKQDKKGVKQPENMVYYKSKNELYSTLHTCIVLRELPEISPQDVKKIEEKEGGA